MKSIFIIFCFLSVALAHEVRIRNNCQQTIWPGLLGNWGKETPLSGGFQLNSGHQQSFFVGRGWAGRVWGRTSCGSNGQCETGNCGEIQCNGRSGEIPATLAEIKFDGDYGLDFYDISNVDGFNLPISMRPISGYKLTSNTKYDCKTADCPKNINLYCPAEWAKKSGSTTVACYNRSPPFFKQHCPNAYSYDYDDQTSTFTCTNDPETNYEIVFCP